MHFSTTSESWSWFPQPEVGLFVTLPFMFCFPPFFAYMLLAA